MEEIQDKSRSRKNRTIQFGIPDYLVFSQRDIVRLGFEI
jgi:hypothetical protein